MTMTWKGLPVLVTGADGFIGSHLVERLVALGAKVRSFAYYNSFGTWGWLDAIPEKTLGRIEIFPGDIRDPNRVAEAVRGQSVVFHLSSLIAIPYSYHAPDSYVQTNVTGALNVLNACRAEKVDRLIHTSTSEVYGTAQYVPIDEKHPLQGQSPYSASKIGADVLADSYFRSFGLPVATVRPFNTYGPRQSARAVIPTIISQLYGGVKKLQLGALTPTRDFNYVADTVEGFLAAAASKQAVGQVLNVGSGREISIGDLVETLMTITGRRVPVATDKVRLRPGKSEVNRLLCDNSRVLALTGWKPRVSLEEGLTRTCRWVRQNLKHFKPASYSV